MLFALTGNAETFILTDGTKYENVSIKRVEPDGIVVVTDSGISKIPFSKLSPEVQAAHGYDPNSADEFKKQQQAQQAAAYAKSLEDKKIADAQAKQKAEAAATQERQQKLAKSAEQARIKIVQVLPGGALADRMQQAVVSSSSASIGGGGGAYSYYERSGDIYYYEGLTNIAEGDSIDVMASRDGSYSYTDTRGASRTVQKWIVISQAEKK